MGPLQNLKIIEFAGLGAAPFAAMLLADLGAEVIRIDRPGRPVSPLPEPRKDLLNRGRKSILIDLKSDRGRTLALKLVTGADGLTESYRPGVMESMGLGPEECLALNPRLVYGRLSGWGHQGPLAKSAGHDINYIALSGVLAAIGNQDQPPVLPLNLVADFAGGGLMLAFGMLAALLEVKTSGKGQVVDVAMIEGSALMMTLMHSLASMGLWSEQRGDNLLDGAAPFYRSYECADGKYLAVGALEPQFYQALIELLGLEDEAIMQAQMERDKWPEQTNLMAARIKLKTRDQWAELGGAGDACLTPVLTMSESVNHPQMKAREVYLEKDGLRQVAPTPAFSRSKTALDLPPPVPGEHTCLVLGEMGLSREEIAVLLSEKIVEQSEGKS